MNLKQASALLIGLLTAAGACAGNATGKVGKVSVGRMGNQVFIELQSDSYAVWPCATTHADGYRYAFLLSEANDRAMLATVLAAQASGQNLQVVGKGTCTLDAGMEDVHYVVVRP